MRENYFFGVNIKDDLGRDFSDSQYEAYVRAATSEIEKTLDIKLEKQKIQETFQFNHDDWIKWGYVKTTYPVICALGLDGFLNTTKQVAYPKQWLSVRKTSDGVTYHRRISVVPAGNATGANYQVIFSGIVPQLGYLNMSMIPDYWTVKYVTGFDVIPYDIIDVVGKLASIGPFNIAGDLILGAGIASFSLGLDGLSQSLSTTSSATNAGFGARIITYKEELKNSIPRLKDFYKGLGFAVC